MFPNSLFNRPGPHRAYEVDPVKHRELCAAIEQLVKLGESTALIEFLAAHGRPPGPVDSYTVSSSFQYCLVGDDFGMRNYGPMFERVGFQTVFGSPLIPCAEPVSYVWLELHPSFPQQLATAAELLRTVKFYEDPPATMWDALVQDIPRDGATRSEAELRAIVGRWRKDCGAEIEAFAAKLREIAARDGVVANWSDAEGGI